MNGKSNLGTPFLYTLKNVCITIINYKKKYFKMSHISICVLLYIHTHVYIKMIKSNNLWAKFFLLKIYINLKLFFF